MEGAVVIHQVENSELCSLCCMLCIFSCFVVIENEKPTIKNLNRYVTRKYTTDWQCIGIELGLGPQVLKAIEKDYPQDNFKCFQETLDKWLQLKADGTWKTLEIALTNVTRAKLELDPVDDMYSKLLCVATLGLCVQYHST